MPCAKSPRACSVCTSYSVPGKGAIHSTPKQLGPDSLLTCQQLNQVPVYLSVSIKTSQWVVWVSWEACVESEALGKGNHQRIQVMADLCVSASEWKAAGLGVKRLISHEEIQSVWGCPCVSMCTHAHWQKWGKDGPAAGHTATGTSVQWLSTYVCPNSRPSSWSARRGHEMQTELFGLALNAKWFYLCWYVWPWPWSCAYQSCTPLSAHGEGTLMLQAGWLRQHWPAAPHFFQAWMKTQNPRSFKKLYALLHCKPLKH